MSNQSAPTLADVAREAGVSLATTSRVLNGSARKVAESYRTRVQAAADRIGYSTNFSAQAMARGTSRTAALLVSDIADPFFSSIASGVAAAADRSGLLVTMAVTGRDPARELELVRELRGLRPRVVILVGSRSVEEAGRESLVRELDSIRAAGGRVVVVGQHGLPFATVRVDDAAGAAALATALVGLGFRRFAILGGPHQLDVARERLVGFRQGLAAAGMPLDDVHVIHGDFTRDGGYQATTDLLRRGIAGLDALVAVNDVMAIGAATALRESGIRIPEDIALAGFDDIPAAVDAAPPLSTVRIPLEDLGRRAFELALGDGDATVVLHTEVVLRASTRPRSMV